MLTQGIWWLSNALMLCLLGRAISGGFFKKYLIFYTYLSLCLFTSFFRFYFYISRPTDYRSFWWYTQFLSIAVGYCVIWEIYKQALQAYPGTVEMARYLIWTLFVAVLVKALGSSLWESDWALARTVGELERDLRAVQAMLLVVVVSVLAYYLIPIGRNLRGIIFGYGFFIAMGVINNTVRSHLGDTFQIWWRYTQSTAWLMALVVWLGALWSYSPNPAPEAESGLERDYELLSFQTTHAIAKARGYFLKTVKS